MDNVIKKNSLFLMLIPFIIIGIRPGFTSVDNAPLEGKVQEDVKLDITMGRGPNCTGRGICNLKTSPSQDSHATVNGRIYFNDADKLILDLCRRNMDESTKAEQIIDSKFEIIDTYIVPIEIMNELGVSNTYTIETGEYQVAKTSKSYKIEF